MPEPTFKKDGRVLPISESTRKRNPELYGAVGGLQAKEPKPNQRSQGQDCQLEQGQESVGYRIKLIVVSRRRMDAHDNLRSSLKPIVDQITASLGFASDDDPALKWSYSQITGRDSDDRKD